MSNGLQARFLWPEPIWMTALRSLKNPSTFSLRVLGWGHFHLCAHVLPLFGVGDLKALTSTACLPLNKAKWSGNLRSLPSLTEFLSCHQDESCSQLSFPSEMQDVLHYLLRIMAQDEAFPYFFKSSWSPHLFNVPTSKEQVPSILSSWSPHLFNVPTTRSPLVLLTRWIQCHRVIFCCIVGHRKRPCMPIWLKISLWDHNAMLKCLPSLDELEERGSWLFALWGPCLG